MVPFSVYLAFLNLPGVAPVFCFFFADPLTSGNIAQHCSRRTFLLDDRDPVTLKNESRRPCVLPCLLFTIFLQPLRILSSLQHLVHLNCFSSHMNWISPSSSGSLHFSSTVEQSTTSGLKNRPLASLISSMLPCCLMRSMALFGPIPLMVPQ
uniref:Uncharacterized protein n=1 Tax=Amphilophus citrinellus TaxID=61819 RepID=A0A3Q0SVN3_AMPCI